MTHARSSPDSGVDDRVCIEPGPSSQSGTFADRPATAFRCVCVQRQDLALIDVSYAPISHLCRLAAPMEMTGSVIPGALVFDNSSCR